MNERIINELVEKAITQNEPDWPQFRKHLTGSGALYLHVFAETLAELIVRECAMIVEGFEITQEVALDEYVDYEASAVLKEHFGVES